MHHFGYCAVYQISFFVLLFYIYLKTKQIVPLSSANLSYLMKWNLCDLEKQNLFAPPYFNLLRSPSSLRLMVVFCSPSSTFPCKMNGTDAAGQDSTPWAPSPHYSLSMRSTNLFLDRHFPPNLSLLWGLIDIETEGRWANREPPNQRGDDTGATSHDSGLWKKQVVELFSQSKKLTERDILWLWTAKVEILVLFEGMDGA